MQTEQSELGSTIKRAVTAFSVHGFEAELDDSWRFFTSSDPHNHRVYCNDKKLQLLTYCQGDVTIKQAPDQQTFQKECLVEIDLKSVING